MTYKTPPETLEDEALDAVCGAGSKTFSEKTDAPRGVLLFDEADALRADGAQTRIVANGGGNSI